MKAYCRRPQPPQPSPSQSPLPDDPFPDLPEPDEPDPLLPDLPLDEELPDQLGEFQPPTQCCSERRRHRM